MVQTNIISYLDCYNGLLSVSTLISQQSILPTAARNCSLKHKSYYVTLLPKLSSVLPLHLEKIQTLKHTLSGLTKNILFLPVLATSTTSSFLTISIHTGLLVVLWTGQAYTPVCGPLYHFFLLNRSLCPQLISSHWSLLRSHVTSLESMYWSSQRHSSFDPLSTPLPVAFSSEHFIQLDYFVLLGYFCLPHYSKFYAIKVFVFLYTMPHIYKLSR